MHILHLVLMSIRSWHTSVCANVCVIFPLFFRPTEGPCERAIISKGVKESLNFSCQNEVRERGHDEHRGHIVEEEHEMKCLCLLEAQRKDSGLTL